MPRKTPLIGKCVAPTCTEENQVLAAFNLCKRHYQRLYRHGSIDETDHRIIHPVNIGNKFCGRCNQELSLDAFRSSKRGNIACYCKACETIYYRARKSEKIAKNECVSCGRKAISGITQCEKCRKRQSQYVSQFLPRTERLLRSAKQRAISQGVNCTIDIEWILKRITERCELSGIPFDLEGKQKYARQRFNPYSPSIDRKTWGDYSPDNCRLILTALNVGINHWGEDVYRKIAKAYLQSRKFKKKKEIPLSVTFDLPLEGQHAQSLRIRKH